MIVIHSHYDVPVRFAQWVTAPLNIIPGVNLIWGDMGRVGYTGDDKRGKNLDRTKEFQGHSKLFNDYGLWNCWPMDRGDVSLMSDDYKEMLMQISGNISELKDDLVTKLHAVTLELTEARGDIKGFSRNFEERINHLVKTLEKVEITIGAHEQHFAVVNKELHQLEIKVLALKTVPASLEEYGQKLDDLEKEFAVLTEKFKTLDKTTELHAQKSDRNSQAISSQKAVSKFLQSKPIWAMFSACAAALLTFFGIKQ